MSGTFMLFTWGVAIISALIATFSLKAPRVLSIILGVILAQGLMFAGGHMLHLDFGPIIDIGGTSTPVVTDIVLALVGAFLGAFLTKAFRRGR
ncbi:hypothetical protein CBW65_13420 [Tumebacillus avium]|uniref:Uncharacterized protein n=1 Tax=Tumebacillus avium TaxID=1903704 RepID=A0A1Y0IN17_9BACL|nr:hypothetical protein [Tumebacillus avium]ARU61921.1 hypothetical protein CBW65_13420 [Tumebacillus avium]